MAPSPHRTRRKPRHARPRRRRLPRPCTWCLHDAAEAATGPASQMLLNPAGTDWRDALLILALTLVHRLVQPCPHTLSPPTAAPTVHERPCDL
ncbi:hypothetical protein GCM10010326_65340 [Streptomyces xanthochromogenes]|uniref:Transposase n=1 Tax=Streptomyces xanthochromogenes TaxID=67384 RepID=A0ABQ3AP89_9ACTN|nr:hypothetical protein GCM10010326_65340 [Streptomyces xanthochromogenes]